MKKSILIGITGGTGSGKTTVAKKVKNFLSDKLSTTIIQQDSYYIDRSNVPLDDRDKINYDHPKSIDYNLIVKHLSMLLRGETIKLPSYNFVIHTREKSETLINPTDVVIIEGILIFHWKEIREILNYKIFVDTPDDIRIIRRITRDIKKRGRNFHEVIKQYFDTVRPMHIEFVEPTKRFADIIITEGGHNKTAIEMIGQSVLRKFYKSI